MILHSVIVFSGKSCLHFSFNKKCEMSRGIIFEPRLYNKLIA